MNLRILLVDDSERFLDAAERFLSEAPGLHVVGRARSGGEAISMVERRRPDLVLMDLVMPGMTGIEASRRIKCGPDAPRIIVLSLHDSPCDRMSAAATADAFVSKPEFVDTLIPAITRLFAGTKRRDV